MCTILVISLALIAALLLFAATKPNEFRVERSIQIKAHPDKIFAFINDHHNWEAWSPWNKLDPEMKKTISGAPSGPGAIFEWEGNKKAGAGRNEIIASVPSSKILMKLDMFRPFKSSNQVEFTLKAEGENTLVTWALFGPQPYMGKLMSILINCDKMVGKDFEEGLNSLKKIAEA